MYVRLAFAVAAYLEPEILIVDEVLAVGDAGLPAKVSTGRMGEYRVKSGRTVLFVSHNMAAIEALCTRAILLEAGAIACDGEASGAIQEYLTRYNDRGDERTGLLPARLGDVCLQSFGVEDAQGRSTRNLDFLEPFRIKLDIEITEYKRDLHALIILWRRNDGCRVASITTRELPCGELGVGSTRLTCHIEPNPLLPGDYYWSVSLLNSNFQLKVDDVGSFAIQEKVLPACSHPFTRFHGITHICSRIDKEYQP